MKKTILQITLGTLFLMLAYAAPGRASVLDCTSGQVSVTPDSDSTPEVYTYYLTATTTCAFSEDTIVAFSQMGGVTNALVDPSTSLSGDGALVSSGPTAANFDFLNGALLTTGNNGTLEIDCSSCMTGNVDWTIGDDPNTVPGPVPATTAAPEPGSIALLLCGLAGLAFLLLARPRQHAYSA